MLVFGGSCAGGYCQPDLYQLVLASPPPKPAKKVDDVGYALTKNLALWKATEKLRMIAAQQRAAAPRRKLRPTTPRATVPPTSYEHFVTLVGRQRSAVISKDALRLLDMPSGRQAHGSRSGSREQRDARLDGRQLTEGTTLPPLSQNWGQEVYRRAMNARQCRIKEPRPDLRLPRLALLRASMRGASEPHIRVLPTLSPVRVQRRPRVDVSSATTVSSAEFAAEDLEVAATALVVAQPEGAPLALSLPELC